MNIVNMHMLNMTICSLNNRIQVLIVHINYRERISLNLVIRLCICQAEVYKQGCRGEGISLALILSGSIVQYTVLPHACIYCVYIFRNR